MSIAGVDAEGWILGLSGALEPGDARPSSKRLKLRSLSKDAYALCAPHLQRRRVAYERRRRSSKVRLASAASRRITSL
jgi:hypothetical protein